ncbi:MAG: response regulator [bacterium]
MTKGTGQLGALDTLLREPGLAASILDTVDSLVVVLNRQGRPVLLNRACVEATGHTFSDLQEKPFWESLVAPQDMVGVNSAFLEMRNNRQPVRFESTCPTRNGRSLRVAWSNQPLVDAEGMIQYIVCTGMDVSAHVQAANEHLRRSDELEGQLSYYEELLRTKGEFLAKVSHELRTPLLTGLGYIDLLLGGHLGHADASVHDRMKVALRNLRRLSALVDDILAYQAATTRSPGESLRFDAVDIREICQECVGEFLVRHEDRQDRMVLETPDTLVLVRANADQLRMALSNLLENAARHAGPTAKITLSVDFITGRRVAVSVCDNGIGMDEKAAEAVFDPFVQVGSNRSGSGLGLAIIKEILSNHRTEPNLQSSPDEGTRVSFILMLSDAAAALPRCLTPVSVPIIRSPAHARILVVDDDRDTLDFLSLALESTGYEVLTAASGEAALEKIESVLPDLFILDLTLPGGIDGFKLCRLLKAKPRTTNIPVYMFTGRGDSLSRRRAEAVGCDGYLVKPSDTATLLRAVQLALGDLGGA